MALRMICSGLGVPALRVEHAGDAVKGDGVHPVLVSGDLLFQEAGTFEGEHGVVKMPARA